MTASGASALTVPSVPVGSVSVPSVSVPSLPSVPLPAPSVSAPKLPLPSVSVPSVPALPLPSASVPQLPVPSGSVPPVSVPSVPVPVSTAPVPGVPSVPGAPSVPGVPAPVGSVLSGVQSGVSTIGGSLSGVAGGTTGSLLNLGVNASPIGTACVQARGTGSAIANVTVTVGGHNITAPLVQALPGVLAPCPAGATPGSPGVGASAGGGLVGACVQATAKAPLNASVLVLDTELVGTLAKAGVPLQQVIVPCPKGLPGGPPGSGGTGATAGSSGAGAAAGLGAAAGGAAGSAAAGGKGQGGSGTNCTNGAGGWSSLNAQTLSSVIPSNIPQTLPWVLLALALLGRRRLGRAVASVRAFRGLGRFRVQT